MRLPDDEVVVLEILTTSDQLAVGTGYSRGERTVADVARVLGIAIPDAIFWLEQAGYGRALDKILLSADRRREIASRIRQDRLRRQGKPVHSPDLVRREVIATERLEGIDARAWFGRSDQQR